MILATQIKTIPQLANIDALPSSLMDSTMSPKAKIVEKGVGVHSLACNTSRVKECVGASGWGLRRLISK
jgi:hypothetical protein